MKMSCRTLSQVSFAILTLFIAVDSAQAATIIYQDTLLGSAPADGSDYQSVGGTSPAIDLPAATWNAEYYSAPSATVDGWNGTRYTYNNSFSAQLPLTLDGTSTYVLSVDVNYASGVYQNLDFGFIPSGQSTSSNPDPSTSVALIEVEGGGPAVASYGNNTASASTSYTPDVAEHYTITLDSSTGTVDFALDGTSFANYANALSSLQMASIADITLGGYYSPSNAYYTNLSLTEVATVPEPGTWVLLALGLGALVVWTRRHELALARL